MFKPYKVGSTITDIFLQTGLGCFESSELKTNLVSIDSTVKDKQHETQKPEELLSILIKMFSKETHTILDMFMGSGTTGVACVNLNRKFIGIELDKDYFDIGVNRVLKAQED